MTTPHEQRLRAAALRVTRPRLAVLDVLDEAGRRREHLPVSEIAEGARRRLGVVSTQAVYDCLDNHHHLVCRDFARHANSEMKENG